MNTRPLLPIAVLTSALLGCTPALSAAGAAPAATPPPPADMTWWRDARLGLFIHWGPVSLRGTEIGWSRGAQVPEAEYDQLYRSFNPTNFNARQWARLARDAGARYLVLTTKHHDGFCLWPSRETDYTIAHTPFRRDVVAELSAACRKEGVVFCTYHSICDWHHPDYPLGSPGGKTRKPNPNMDRYRLYLKTQLAELIQGYGPLGILWFDGEWEEPWTADYGVDLYTYCRRLQPSIIVNNRVTKGREGMQGRTTAGVFGGDYDTPEQEVGKFQIDRPWESCITIGEQWAWKPNEKLKSVPDLIRTLLQCAGGDGNLLLNVGPMPDGQVEGIQAERLRELGSWLKRYGKSVYATRGGPFKPGPWGVSTRRGRDVYLHVLDWHDQETISLPHIDARIAKASLLTKGPVSVLQEGGATQVRVVKKAQHAVDTIVRLQLDQDAMSLHP